MSVGYGWRVTSRNNIAHIRPSIEHFDTSELSKRGVRMGYTPDVLTDAGAKAFTTINAWINANASCRPHCNVGAHGWQERWTHV